MSFQDHECHPVRLDAPPRRQRGISICGVLTMIRSIYRWRGARVENVQQFRSDFPAAELYRLEQNYRSTGSILEAANALIAHNSGRLGKNL